MRFSWVCKGWSWWEVKLVNVSYHISYSFLRQDVAVAQATFYRVAGLKSLANHWLRLYHTHKVWCRSMDEGLIEYGKAWLSMVRPMSGLLTILLVSLLQYVKMDTLGTLCKMDLDWTHHHFVYFYITDKLCFYILIFFWYPYFLLLSMNPLAHNWGLSLPLTLVCYS